MGQVSVGCGGGGHWQCVPCSRGEMCEWEEEKDFSGAVPRLMLVKDACLSRALKQHLPGLSATKKHVSVLQGTMKCGQLQECGIF